MNIREFKEKRGLKESIRTIKLWLKKGHILDAYQLEGSDEWFIPETSLAPYTQARAKNETAIRKSIVKGISENRRVFAELYKIDEETFNVLVNQLLAAGIIVARKVGKHTFYNTSLKAEEFLKSYNPDSFLLGINVGVVKAEIKKNL